MTKECTQSEEEAAHFQLFDGASHKSVHGSVTIIVVYVEIIQIEFNIHSLEKICFIRNNLKSAPG